MGEFIFCVLADKFPSMLSSIFNSKFKTPARVKEAVRHLESNFCSIQAVINDVETRKVKEEAVKVWLDKFKDISYEIDDVLDEWNTYMIEADIEKAESFFTRKRKVLLLINNFIPFGHISHKIKELNRKLDVIEREREMYKFVLTRGNEEVERPKTTSIVDVSETLGRDKVKDDLVSILLGKGTEKERSPHVISLVGMGGIGKTTLAQLAYNDPEVKAHFEIRIWVCVSQPFDQCRIAKEILESIECQSTNTFSFQILINRICDEVRGKGFFLVLDDVWTEDSTLWEPFRLALKYGAPCSRILVTTRKNIVAEMMESTCMINLEVLSDKDCWLMFSKIAFYDKDLEQHKQLEDLGRQIAKKCKGLPLAAKTLGSLMRFKKSREQWKHVLDCNLWELEEVERSLFASLLLSYYDLPSPLKRCFSFCAIFPKDYVFYIDELVFTWIAQGYIDSKDNREMEIIAREYFNNLAILSFFQNFEKTADDGKIVRCQMHDIVHDFAQLMTQNECFIINTDIKLGSDYKKARHLRLKILEEAQFPMSIYSAKNLRTLILEYRSDYNLSNLFQYFRCLRALTLNCLGGMINEVSGELKNLIHLRYLNLLNYGADQLPETICNLFNLQILKITISSNTFKILPQGMGRLINLRHLILDVLDERYPIRQLKFPRGFGRLISLRRLSHFFVSGKDDTRGCKLEELKNLNHLQGDLEIGGLGNVVDVDEAENAQLKKKIHLRTLVLNFDGKNDRRMENDVLLLNALEPPPNLEYLNISQYQGTTMSPKWMMSLTQLKTLKLWHCMDLECLPSPLGKLPFLKSLDIWKAHSVKKVGVEFLGIESKNIIEIFPNLKSLIFEDLEEWEEWIGIGGMRGEEENFTIMPRLQELTIYYCPKLKSLPEFLHTTPLKKLMITLTTNQILRERCQRETGEDWPKISHIPNIIIDYKYVQRDGKEVTESGNRKILVCRGRFPSWLDSASQV